MSEEVRIFKLHYSGTLYEPKTENPIELFSLNNILLLYIKKKMRMYIWIGKNATLSLKNMIPRIREIVSREHEDLKVLRYITVESGVEPSEFFDFTGMSEKELFSRIEYLEKTVSPKIQEVSALKVKADEIDDISLKKDQEEFIKEAQVKSEAKKLRITVEEDTLGVKQEFEELLKANNIVDAHAKIKEFRKKYEESYDLKTIPIAIQLFTKDQKMWEYLKKEQADIKQKLETLEPEILSAIEGDDILKITESYDTAKDLLNQSIDEEIRFKWKPIEIKCSAKLVLEECIALEKESNYEEAISKIEEVLVLVKQLELSEYETLLETRLKEIKDAGENYNKVSKEIKELEEKIKDSQDKKYHQAVISYCKKLLELAKSIQKNDAVEEYSKILEQVKKELEEKKAAESKEKEEIIEKVKELKEIVTIEEDTLPMLEEFSVGELIGDLSNDMSAMLDQVGSLLEEHRVEVKKEISNKAIVTSASGEVLELEKDIEVVESDSAEDKLVCNVESGLINPFDDAIEEAILTDLIPYNFEITNVELNGKIVEELPDKSLGKDGMEITWQLQNIPPKEKVEIKYDLRRRISRTLIFILEGQVKIVKTHSNLSASELEGLYDAKMPLTNNYGSVLEGVVVEDIIPLYYLHFVKEPSNVLPAETSSSKMGEIVKWNIGPLQTETMNYHYKLLELYRLEEIKIHIADLSKKGKDSVNDGNLTKALRIYDEIINQLEEYTK